MTEITDARIDAAIERVPKVQKALRDFANEKKPDHESIDEHLEYLKSRIERHGELCEPLGDGTDDAHDFALEIRRLRKREEDARGLLEKVQWEAAKDSQALKYKCPICPGIDPRMNPLNGGHFPDCALAAWLKGE